LSAALLLPRFHQTDGQPLPVTAPPASRAFIFFVTILYGRLSNSMKARRPERKKQRQDHEKSDQKPSGNKRAESANQRAGWRLGQQPQPDTRARITTFQPHHNQRLKER